MGCVVVLTVLIPPGGHPPRGVGRYGGDSLWASSLRGGPTTKGSIPVVRSAAGQKPYRGLRMWRQGGVRPAASGPGLVNVVWYSGLSSGPGDRSVTTRLGGPAPN